jgi:hypothetical protein
MTDATGPSRDDALSQEQSVLIARPDVDRDSLVERVQGHVLDWAKWDRAGVVHQDVDTAVGRL